MSLPVVLEVKLDYGPPSYFDSSYEMVNYLGTRMRFKIRKYHNQATYYDFMVYYANGEASAHRYYVIMNNQRQSVSVRLVRRDDPKILADQAF